MSKVCIVTGGSSGIGRAACRALADGGNAVYEFSRRDIPQDGVTHVTVDVTDEDAVQNAVRSVAEQAGRIDVLVNNAGFGISGCMELTDNKDAQRLMDVNLMGAVSVSKAVIPVMREAGGGKIVNLSSIAGALSLPYQAWYSISKAAVLAFSEALRNEVRQFGIDVCAILPGDIKTGFTDAREKSHEGNELYGGSIDRIREAMPGVEIYVMAVTPTTYAVSSRGSFSMTKIRTLNAALHDMCAEKECWYLDCCELLCDETGYLPDALKGWDGSPHLAVKGYQVWADIIRTHYAD